MLLAANQQSLPSGGDLVYLITLGDVAKKAGALVLSDMRKAGIIADTDYEGKSLKAAMRKANDLQARFVVILGDDEIKDGVISLKDMKDSSQDKIALADLVARLKSSLSV